MRRFKQYPIEDFENFIAIVKVLRPITNIQVHHTAVPTLTDYRLAKDKEAVILGMWRYHTVTRGWQDIAQHFTIAPDGVWDGRSLEIKPAGFIGAQNDGGLMFEIIGFYDVGKESFSGDIANMTYRAVAAVKRRWPKADIRFHRDQPGANKTCPGSAILKPQFEAAIAELLKPKPVTSCDALYALGVVFDVKGWNVKAGQNKALEAVLGAIANNWADLDKVPYVGTLMQRIGDKLGN